MVVMVFSDSAAVLLALRLSAVEMMIAVPTQTIMISTAIPPATNPMFTRRRVRRASQRLANAPNSRVASTTRITGAGILVEAVVSTSTRLAVSSYSVCASGRICVCMSDDASDRYDEPTGFPARLLVLAVSTRPV